eukprot:904096_1
MGHGSPDMSTKMVLLEHATTQMGHGLPLARSVHKDCFVRTCNDTESYWLFGLADDEGMEWKHIIQLQIMPNMVRSQYLNQRWQSRIEPRWPKYSNVYTA